MAVGTRHGIRRRHLVRAVPVLAAPCVVAATLAPLLRSSRSPEPAAAPGPDPRGDTAAVAEETYRGRRIRVVQAGAAAPAGHARAPGCAFEVRIDGRTLPVMRRADGSWLSTVD